MPEPCRRVKERALLPCTAMVPGPNGTDLRTPCATQPPPDADADADPAGWGLQQATGVMAAWPGGGQRVAQSGPAEGVAALGATDWRLRGLSPRSRIGTARAVGGEMPEADRARSMSERV